MGDVKGPPALAAAPTTHPSIPARTLRPRPGVYQLLIIILNARNTCCILFKKDIRDTNRGTHLSLSTVTLF
jgi:hypothetical protein